MRIAKKTTIHSRLTMMQPNRRIGLAIIACISVLVPSLVGAQVGTTLCACQPSSYTLKLDFSLKCRDKNMTSAGVVQPPECITRSGGSTEPSDDVPVSIQTVQFIELDQNLKGVAQAVQSGDFVDGATINYTSIIATQPDALNATSLPRGLQVLMSGETAAGQSLINAFIIVYTNNCSIYPVLEDNEVNGFAVFTNLEAPPQSLCPLAPSSPPISSDVPSSSPILVSSDVPSSSPVSVPSSAPIAQSDAPIAAPSNTPSSSPIVIPKSDAPSSSPIVVPKSDAPSSSPIVTPQSEAPSAPPSGVVSDEPSASPVTQPSVAPSEVIPESQAPSSTPVIPETSTPTIIAPTVLDQPSTSPAGRPEISDLPSTVPSSSPIITPPNGSIITKPSCPPTTINGASAKENRNGKRLPKYKKKKEEAKDDSSKGKGKDAKKGKKKDAGYMAKISKKLEEKRRLRAHGGVTKPPLDCPDIPIESGSLTPALSPIDDYSTKQVTKVTTSGETIYEDSVNTGKGGKGKKTDKVKYSHKKKKSKKNKQSKRS